MPHPSLSLPAYSPLFFLVDENPNDSLALGRALSLTVPSLRLRQASNEREFAQGLSIIDTPTLGLLDWSVTFSEALGLLRRGRERWPTMPWIVFCQTDPEGVRARLARAEIPGPIPTVVPDFSELAVVAQKIATGATPTETDIQRWTGMWNEVPFGVAPINPRQRLIHYANPVLARWVGADAAALVGKKLELIHPAEQVQRLMTKIDRPAVSDAPSLQVEVSFNRAGQIRFADAMLAPSGLDRAEYRTIFYVDASERRAMERKWRSLAETIFQTGSGEEFFHTLVLGLCNVLEVDMAAVALLIPGETARARIVAMCDRGALVDNFEISMAGNPCAEVLKHQFLCVTRRVARSFPAAEWLIIRNAESYLGLPLFDQGGQHIGVLEVMHRQPLRKTRDLRAVMQVFAARAAAELERLCAETARRQTEAGLAHTQRLAHIGSWEIDVATSQFSWSDETYRLHGVERGVFRPTIDRCLELVHCDDRARVDQSLQGALAGQIFSRLAHRVVRPDGTVRHLECEGELVSTSTGRPLVLRGTTLDITNRVEAESEVRRLALVAQETAHAVILLDQHRRIHWVNAGFTRLTGYDASESLGQPAEKFLTDSENNSPEDHALSESWWQEDRQLLEITQRDKAGRRYWIHYSIQPIRDESGRISGHFALGTDTTDQKLTEEVRQLISTGLSNRQRSDFFDHLARETARLLDADMCLVARLTGPEQKQARSLGLWLRGKSLAPAEFDLAGTPGAGILSEEPIVFSSGVAAKFPLNRFLNEQGMESYGGVTLFDSVGRPMGQLAILSRSPLGRNSTLIISLLRMIGGRAAAEVERQEHEQMFRDLFEHAPDATILVDRRGLIVMSNKIAHRMFGYTASEMVSLPVERLMPDTTRAGHAAMREKFHRETTPRVMGSGRPNLRGLRKDGTTFPVDISLSPISTPQGPGAIAAIRDMTEQRVAEAQLRKGQKLESLGQLAGGIAHDFNNILSGILGFAELTLMDLPLDHPLRPNLLKIQQAGLRARSLVAQILAAGRPSSPMLALVQPAQAVREVFELLRPTLPVTIGISLPTDLEGPAILADSAQLHQVLMNLCTNAWQALPDGRGRIDVALATVDVDARFAATHPDLQPGPHVRISIADNGVGMSATTLEHIFDPFFTTKAVGKGTGLGLAVAHGIVKAHQGALSVRSAPGSGTTFEVYLPVHEGPAPHTAPEPNPSFCVLGRGQRVLLVDDDLITGPVLEHLLRRLGYNPVLHQHPRAALDELAADMKSFDLVLTDMTMPDMTGVDLATEVRQLRSDLPVVLLTGLATAHTREAAEQAGVREILQKPVTMDQISVTLPKYLG